MNSPEKAFSLHQNNQFDEAEKIYLALLEVEPENPVIIYAMGLLLYQTSRIDEACSYLKKIPRLRPESGLLTDAFNLLGEIYFVKQDIKEAAKYFSAVLEEDPSNFAANYYCGKIHLLMENPDGALNYFLKALDTDQNQASLYNDMIQAYSKTDNIQGAIKCLNKLTEIEPDNPEHYFNLGLYCSRKGDADGTYRAFTGAIALKPDFAAAHINLAVLHQKLNRFENAEKHYLKALELNDNHPDAYVGLGKTYFDLGNPLKAIDISRKGLQKFPENSKLYFNISKAHFMLENLDEGWEYFRLRRMLNEKKGLKTYLLDFNGQLNDKKILVYWDCGYGDSIQFLRYIPLLAEKCAEVLFSVQEPLINLVKDSNLGATILSSAQKSEEIDYDFQINLTSLAYLFKTGINNFPFKEKYINSNPQKAARWKEKYFNNDGFNVGIVWHSHVNSLRKNIEDVKLFYKMSKTGGINLYSLQQTRGLPLYDGMPEDFKLIRLGDELKDFSDTAAVIENLDLLIAIDTAAAHLAGAMGRPVYCLIPHNPNWRWFMSGENSQWHEKTPWYDSMKLFRQKEAGNWKEVIDRVENDLLLNKSEFIPAQIQP